MWKSKEDEEKPDVGTKEACFGIFKCPECHRDWESRDTWRELGQNCKNCGTLVKPIMESLEPLHFYLCQNCVEATEGKAGIWRDRWFKEGLLCPGCKQRCKPVDFENDFPLFLNEKPTTENEDKEVEAEPEKPAHNEETCEKCRVLERSCLTLFGKPKKEMEIEPEVEEADDDEEEAEASQVKQKTNVEVEDVTEMDVMEENKAEDDEVREEREPEVGFLGRVFNVLRRRRKGQGQEPEKNKEEDGGTMATFGDRKLKRLKEEGEGGGEVIPYEEKPLTPEQIMSAKFESFALIFAFILAFTFPMAVDWIKMEIREWNEDHY